MTMNGGIESAALAGLVAGAAHVLMGPDHLAAVAPFAVRRPRRSWLTGVRWGAGHATGVASVALAGWLFRESFPVELLSSHCERLVGVMLIAIGIWGLRKALSFKIHFHRHSHDGGAPHDHFHLHHHDRDHRDHGHGHAAMGVGVLHGLAGGAHFLGVIPALAMPTRTTAAIYVLFFGAGTVLAMAVFSQAFGVLGSRSLARGGAVAFRRILSACSLASIAVGIYWLL